MQYNQMQYITQNSDRLCFAEGLPLINPSPVPEEQRKQGTLDDRRTQTSVNLKASHPTLLQLFTNNNGFFSLVRLKKPYVYLFNKLLTINYPKAFVVYFSFMLCNTLYACTC
ncbi:MAG: hypothetical protein KME22_01290 [Hassallia sp. WJT32-NPBG1]|jgi:hypothetical protein|nr:hypothetical protein [Hassallia sp. WJT32-NPBG1]